MRIMVNQRRLKIYFFTGACIWLTTTLLIFTDILTDIKVWYITTFIFNLDEQKMVDFLGEETMDGSVVSDPLHKLLLPGQNALNFFHLPLRKYSMSFTEITTANRDTSYPLAPDFTFHIDYDETSVVLYKDYGPGCVYRIFLFPWLTTNTAKLHKLETKDLKHHILDFNIDEQITKHTLDEIASGKTWPFLAPINTQHPKPASGMGAYTPICYQKKMIITYITPKEFPSDLFQKTVSCTLEDKLCPVHIYSGISRHKFGSGTKVTPFSSQALQYKSEKVVKLLKNPELYGPDISSKCWLSWAEICKNCRPQQLYRQDFPGVVTSMQFRLYDRSTSKMLDDWSQVLLSITFDGAKTPQINKVPLGTLFGASGSLNDFNGAALGRRKRYCNFNPGLLPRLPKTAMTGYFFFPMPFWKSIRVTAEGTDKIPKSLVLYYYVHTMENFYRRNTTGYFHARASYFTDNVDGWRNILSIENTWGHIVGLLMNVDNLYARKNAASSNARWAPLQADHLLFTDGSKAATMLGTGLEDYFSYAHGFSMAENTSYSFVGVHHSDTKKPQPLTWHCYRLHILDPIPFHSSIKFIMEGTAKEPQFTQEVDSISRKQYYARINSESKMSGISSLVLYYAKPQVGMTKTDGIYMGNKTSEKDHSYKLIQKMKNNSHFVVNDVQYLGASNTHQSYNVTGRVCHEGESFEFVVNIMPGNKGVYLRRTFHAEEMAGNFESLIRINSSPKEKWYVPLGTLNSRYSLLQDDFLIGPNFTSSSDRLLIWIECVSKWKDVSFEALTIH